MKSARKRIHQQQRSDADNDADIEYGGDSSIGTTEINKNDSNSANVWKILHIALTLLGVVAIVGFVYEFSLNRLMLEKIAVYEELIGSYDARVLENMHLLSTNAAAVPSVPLTTVATVTPVEPCPVCDYSKCMTSCPQCPVCPHCPAAVTAVGSANGANHDLTEQLARQTKKADLLLARNIPLTAALQENAKKELLARYGPGPYIVDISFSFPDTPNKIDNLAIEMAPSHLMPYTVNYFLNQVEAGVWRGCSFMRNAGHVIQAGVVGAGAHKDQCRGKNFRALGVPGVGNDGVLFQEYSPEFPHKKYTVGLAGRPGGPDFYVSIMDNTHNHGPGGQGQYGLAAEADACFAKLLDDGVSIQHVNKMHSYPLRTPGKGYEYFKDGIAIVDMKLRKHA